MTSRAMLDLAARTRARYDGAAMTLGAVAGSAAQGLSNAADSAARGLGKAGDSAAAQGLGKAAESLSKTAAQLSAGPSDTQKAHDIIDAAAATTDRALGRAAQALGTSPVARSVARRVITPKKD